MRSVDERSDWLKPFRLMKNSRRNIVMGPLNQSSFKTVLAQRLVQLPLSLQEGGRGERSSLMINPFTFHRIDLRKGSCDEYLEPPR